MMSQPPSEEPLLSGKGGEVAYSQPTPLHAELAATMELPGLPTAIQNRLWVLNAITFLLNAIVTFTSLTGVFGKTNKQISDAHPTLITPAGYAFSIWGAIFVSEALWVIWQVIPDGGRESRVMRDGVGPWFIWANLFQIAWVFSFAQEAFILSAIFLSCIFLSLGVALHGLTRFRSPSSVMHRQKLKELLIAFPIGLHGGWVAAAALVNINVALVSEQLSIADQLSAAIFSIFLASAIAIFAVVYWRSAVWCFATVWALAAIVDKHGYRDEMIGKVASEGLEGAIEVCYSVLTILAILDMVTLLLPHCKKNRDDATA